VLSFSGIAVWSFLQTPDVLREEVQLARSERSFSYLESEEAVELAPPLSKQADAPVEDRVAGWMDVGQTAEDLSEPGELGYALGAAEGDETLGAAPAGPQEAVTATVVRGDAVLGNTAPVSTGSEDTGSGDTGSGDTGFDLNGADHIGPERAGAVQTADRTPSTESAHGPSQDLDGAAAVAVEVAAVPTVTTEGGAGDDPVEETTSPAVALTATPARGTNVGSGSSVVPGDAAPALQETVSEGAGRAPQPSGDLAAVEALEEVFGNMEGWSVVSVEFVDDPEALPEGVELVEELVDAASEPGVLPEPARTAEEQVAEPTFHGPGCVPAPLERLGIAEAPRTAAFEPAPTAQAPHDEHGQAEAEAGLSDWLMALAAPAFRAGGMTPLAPVGAPSSEIAAAQMSLAEPGVAPILETSGVEPGALDWSTWDWADPVAMSPLEDSAAGSVVEAVEDSLVDSVEEAPFEPRIVEIEVFDPIEDEFAFAEPTRATEGADDTEAQVDTEAQANAETEANAEAQANTDARGEGAAERGGAVEALAFGMPSEWVHAWQGGDRWVLAAEAPVVETPTAATSTAGALALANPAAAQDPQAPMELVVPEPQQVLTAEDALEEGMAPSTSDAPLDQFEAAGVAATGPALPEVAPVLTPPSPDLVTDLTGDVDLRGPDQTDGVASEVLASVPSAVSEDVVQAEIEVTSLPRTVEQKEVEVEVVDSVVGLAPTRQRRQVLQRVDDERYWRFKSVPNRKFDAEQMMFTPNVGNVRVVLLGGEAFDGRLHSVGKGKVLLDTEMGRMAVDARRVERVDRITGDRSSLRRPSSTSSTAGLKRVKVQAQGGVFYGHLVSQEGSRVTLLMSEGFRITLESNDVTEAADPRGGRLRRVEPR
ncbi:MAG: hypothetical protein P8M11_01650, partial [Planctomycetota bacterium]|nr:hypothetical protein [Planctomycetota bacterium]